MSGVLNPVTLNVASGDDFIDGVLTSHRWSEATIYYSFPTSNTVYNYTTGTNMPNNFSVLTQQQEDAANFALNTAYGGNGFTATASAGFSAEGFTNLNIIQDTSPDTTSPEHIRYGNTSSAVVGTARVADFPSNEITGQLDDNGDVWFGGSGTTPTAGNYHWHTVIHETGHALGLAHGHSTHGIGSTLPTNKDSMEYSIMTYKSYVNDPLNGGYSNETWGYAQTFMMADIAALQYMYGADYTTNSGDTVYKWDPSSGDTMVNGSVGINAGGNRIFATIWDGGGTDTYDLSLYTTDLDLDLRAGEHSVFSAVQLANLGDGNTSRGNIFNALMFGSNTASLIENAIGGSGNDTIQGNEKDNVLKGSLGNDTLRGGDGHDTLYGGADNDTLYGDAGNDTLFGKSGNDTMYGGTGNDTFSYTSGHAPTGVSEYIHGGADYDRILLTGAGTFDFGIDFNVVDVEEIEFEANGSNKDKTLIMGNKELDGSSEFLNVKIDGNNATGSDDTIIINMNSSSTLTLAGWTFQDWMSASVGGSNTDRIYIYGTGLDDTVTGSIMDDIIEGAGGIDVLKGGQGNDLLKGGSGADQLVGGADDDRLIGGGGKDVLNGGNGDDKLIGSGGGDTLNGGNSHDNLFGGNGNDKLTGGTGHDIFVFSKGKDTVYDYSLAGNSERIDLSDVASIVGFNDLVNNHLTFAGSNAKITDASGNIMKVIGVTSGDFDANDFIF